MFPGSRYLSIEADLTIPYFHVTHFLCVCFLPFPSLASLLRTCSLHFHFTLSTFLPNLILQFDLNKLGVWSSVAAVIGSDPIEFDCNLDPMEEENGVCKAESVDGSLDVWNCQNSDSSSADHLVVMVHGILGR